jgi:hypothetical protein
VSSRRAIQSVLHNFLGAFASRYSDLDGSWLFGCLVGILHRDVINLLDREAARPSAASLDIARQLAVRRFAEQAANARIPLHRIREAHLDISRSPEARAGLVGGRTRLGYDVTFVASAASDSGRAYTSRQSVFVAPHDAALERRSGRGARSGLVARGSGP